MNPATLHVVFSPSAAVNLREALVQLGRADQVVALFDDLSFGPINPPDLAQRARWVETELGWGDWDALEDGVHAFWTAALSDCSHRIAWTSRRCSKEYAGFLEFVWRLGALSCDVIDLSNLLLPTRNKAGEVITSRLAGSVGSLRAEEILENNLLNQAHSLTPQMRHDYRAIWQTLREEDAALRILSPELDRQSAPITVFDDRLLSLIMTSWSRAALVVGEALCSFWDEGLHQVDDLVLAGRLGALVDEGVIQGRGDLPLLKGSEVRLADDPISRRERLLRRLPRQHTRKQLLELSERLRIEADRQVGHALVVVGAFDDPAVAVEPGQGLAIAGRQAG